MDSLKNQKPARLVKTGGRLEVKVAAEIAEGLCTYLRFHTIHATLPDPDEGAYVTLQIDDNVDEDVVQSLLDDWNRELYGASAGNDPGPQAGEGGPRR